MTYRQKLNEYLQGTPYLYHAWTDVLRQPPARWFSTLKLGEAVFKGEPSETKAGSRESAAKKWYQATYALDESKSKLVDNPKFDYHLVQNPYAVNQVNSGWAILYPLYSADEKQVVSIMYMTPSIVLISPVAGNGYNWTYWIQSSETLVIANADKVLADLAKVGVEVSKGQLNTTWTHSIRMSASDDWAKWPYPASVYEVMVALSIKYQEMVMPAASTDQKSVEPTHVHLGGHAIPIYKKSQGLRVEGVSIPDFETTGAHEMLMPAARAISCSAGESKEGEACTTGATATAPTGAIALTGAPAGATAPTGATATAPTGATGGATGAGAPKNI